MALVTLDFQKIDPQDMQRLREYHDSVVDGEVPPAWMLNLDCAGREKFIYHYEQLISSMPDGHGDFGVVDRVADVLSDEQWEAVEYIQGLSEDSKEQWGWMRLDEPAIGDNINDAGYAFLAMRLSLIETRH